VTDHELLTAFQAALASADYYSEKATGGLLQAGPPEADTREFLEKRQALLERCTELLNIGRQRSPEIRDALLATLLEYELPPGCSAPNNFIASLHPDGYQFLREALLALGLKPILSPSNRSS
jgi:hypothetical protein